MADPTLPEAWRGHRRRLRLAVLRALDELARDRVELTDDDQGRPPIREPDGRITSRTGWHQVGGNPLEGIAKYQSLRFSQPLSY